MTKPQLELLVDLLEDLSVQDWMREDERDWVDHLQRDIREELHVREAREVRKLADRRRFEGK